MGDFDGMTEERSRELDGQFPNGWDVAYTQADADKLYAGGITAVRPAGEVWPEDDDEPEDGEEFTGEPLDDGDGPSPGELAKPWETRVHD